MGLNLIDIQKIMGRIPNKIEEKLLIGLQRSFAFQSTYQLEITQTFIERTKNPDVLIISQGHDDIRGRIAVNTLYANYGKKIGTIKTKKGTILIGKYSDQKTKEKPKLGRLLFMKGSRLEPFINKLQSRKIISTMIPVHKSGLGYALVNYLVRYDYGFRLDKSIIPLLASKRGHGILIHADRKSVPVVQSIKSIQKKLIKIGSIQQKSGIVVVDGEQDVGSLPKQLINLIPYQNKLTEEIKLQNKSPVYESPNLVEKKSFNNELKILFKEDLKEDPISFIIKNKTVVGYSTSVSDYIDYKDYELSAITALTNASRNLTCYGFQPEVATGFISLPENNSAEKGSFLKGIRMVGKALNITMDNFAFKSEKNILSGEFFIAGQSLIDFEFSEFFTSADQFILILGSHRGELGGSRYLALKNQVNKGNRPLVDLAMESRLQEAVLTGIRSKLIQFAKPVGRGGIATTIARSFPKSSNIGARINFSGKLNTAELLFGETQGAVLVTINEIDLMEFERVCMTIGIPTTTIGRVTNDGKYSFNKSINLTIDYLRK